MTDRDVIQLFETHHPKSVEDIQALGVSCIYVSRGCARHVYRVGNLAVKIELGDTWQSKKEVECMKAVHEDPDLEPFRQHIPPLFYERAHEDGSKGRVGVIVTKYYPAEVPRSVYIKEEHENLRKAMQRAGIQDIHIANFRLDENGTLVAIDLGYYTKRAPEAVQV